MPATWTTKDGRTIPIAEMDTSHLRSAIAMLNCGGMKRAEELWFLLFGPQPSGDMAQMAHAAEADGYDDVPLTDVMLVSKYKALKAELARREGM